MVKAPNCKNHNWKAKELESKIEEKVRELLRFPKIAEEIVAARRPKMLVPAKNIEIEKRVWEIDRQIGNLQTAQRVLQQADRTQSESGKIQKRLL